jgi:hypothetical protein
MIREEKVQGTKTILKIILKRRNQFLILGKEIVQRHIFQLTVIKTKRIYGNLKIVDIVREYTSSLMPRSSLGKYKHSSDCYQKNKLATEEMVFLDPKTKEIYKVPNLDKPDPIQEMTIN